MKPAVLLHPHALHCRKGTADARGVEGFIEDISKLHPIGHLAHPEDIAYAVLCLASDESILITGSDLVVDGGYTVP